MSHSVRLGLSKVCAERGNNQKVKTCQCLIPPLYWPPCAIRQKAKKKRSKVKEKSLPCGSPSYYVIIICDCQTAARLSLSALLLCQTRSNCSRRKETSTSPRCSCCSLHLLHLHPPKLHSCRSQRKKRGLKMLQWPLPRRQPTRQPTHPRSRPPPGRPEVARVVAESCYITFCGAPGGSRQLEKQQHLHGSASVEEATKRRVFSGVRQKFSQHCFPEALRLKLCSCVKVFLKG